MKRIIIAAASVAAILIILSIIFGRLEPLLGLLGLGAISGNQIMSKAKEAGRKARAKERERLSKMSDQEVVDSDPVSKRIVTDTTNITGDAVKRAFDTDSD